MLLNQSNIFLLEFVGRHWCVILSVASWVIELGLSRARGRWPIHRVVVDDHVVGAVLETHALLILIRLRRLRCFSVVLLQLLAAWTDQLICILRIYYNLMRIVPIISIVKNLILVLNLIVIWKLGWVIHADFATTVTRVLHAVRVRVTHAAGQCRGAYGIVWSVVESTAVAATACMVHHHLGIVKFGLYLTAFIRSVQSILSTAHLPISHLLTIWCIALHLVALLVSVSRRSRLIWHLLLVKMMLRLALKMARCIVVTRRKRDVLWLNAVVPRLPQRLLMWCQATSAATFHGQKCSLTVARAILLVIIAWIRPDVRVVGLLLVIIKWLACSTFHILLWIRDNFKFIFNFINCFQNHLVLTINISFTHNKSN